MLVAPRKRLKTTTCFASLLVRKASIGCKESKIRAISCFAETRLPFGASTAGAHFRVGVFQKNDEVLTMNGISGPGTGVAAPALCVS